MILLIVPQGIETYLLSVRSKGFDLLIVPQGIETQNNDNAPKNYRPLNCTTRN